MYREDAGAHASRHGCNYANKCAGTATWRYSTGVSQYFCNEEQTSKGDRLSAVTWASSAPQEWATFEQTCSEAISCPNGQTCTSERHVMSVAGIDIEWQVGHGCHGKCERATALTRDGEYWEEQCDFDYIDENAINYPASSVYFKIVSTSVWFTICAIIGVILCCLCCCGVFGKGCCWYDCYQCKNRIAAEVARNQHHQHPPNPQPHMINTNVPMY